jgi:hypothetical protein
MKIKLSSISLLALLFFFLACKKDNKKMPDATITGRVVFSGQPVAVRSNGVQLEVWQRGYQLFTKIPLYVAQDGTFSVAVFDGDYKITLLKGNGPWADKTDSINVSVKGNSNIDFPVDPYFLIKNENFTRAATTINATFNLQKINTTKGLELVRIYVGQTTIVDQTNNVATISKAASAITDLTQPVTLSINVPASLSTKDYVFVRVGVKTLGVTELAYSSVQKIALK